MTTTNAALPKRNSLDLFILLNVASLAVILHTPLFASLPDPIRQIFSFLMVFVLPGYALSQALFVDAKHSGIEKSLMTTGLSFVVTVLGAVLLNMLPWGLQKWTWMLLFYGIIILACVVAVFRRGGFALMAPDFEAAMTHMTMPNLAKSAMFMLAGGIAISALWIARSAEEYANRFEQTSFTQFWMLPAAKEANNTAFKVGVQSSESNPVAYRLQISIDGKAVFEKTDLKLNPGERWERTITIAAANAATPKTAPAIAEARLFRTIDPPDQAYRWVRVNLNE